MSYKLGHSDTISFKFVIKDLYNNHGLLNTLVLFVMSNTSILPHIIIFHAFHFSGIRKIFLFNNLSHNPQNPEIKFLVEVL